ncbi:MAG: heat shock protein 90 [Bacteroidetes bacterium ADurb.Bin416]|nr:MAG: heat shock protein 90 [Bacteroidetes bacterium ADurb.Bin416]
MKKLFGDNLPTVDKTTFQVQLDRLGESAAPVVLTQNEFMRRMQDMSSMNPGMGFYGEMPNSYAMVLNTDHPLVKTLVGKEQGDDDVASIKQLMDLALLSNGLLKGEALTQFVKRSYGLIK